MEQRRLYVVRGAARNGTITYRCPTADWALRKLRDLKRAERQNITITGPDGAALTEAELVFLADGSSTALADEPILAAP